MCTELIFVAFCHRSTGGYSGGLLEAGVAGETTHHCDAHQPEGREEGQVPQVLARLWDSAVWPLQSHHH